MFRRSRAKTFTMILPNLGQCLKTPLCALPRHALVIGRVDALKERDGHGIVDLRLAEDLTGPTRSRS